MESTRKEESEPYFFAIPFQKSKEFCYVVYLGIGDDNPQKKLGVKAVGVVLDTRIIKKLTLSCKEPDI